MRRKWLGIISAIGWLTRCWAQNVYECPDQWTSFEEKCYQFVVYPTLPYDEASQACHQDGASLVSVNSQQEYQFIVNQLGHYNGTLQNEWYTSGVDRSGDQRWEGDGSTLVADAGNFVTSEAQNHKRLGSVEAHLVYLYSNLQGTNRFGWAWDIRTKSLPYICEISQQEVFRIFQKNRDFSYGNPSLNPYNWKIGPKLIHQSSNILFVGIIGDVIMSCEADGNPMPTYQWFKYFGTAKEQQITTDTDSRYTITGGRLMISYPEVVKDPGIYTCLVQNEAGKIFSDPISLSHGYLNEFSNDKPGYRTAVLYLGAVIDCSPPSYNPAVSYQWLKNSLFIRPEMNQHTFVSENGKLYFSEIQTTDAAMYQCLVSLIAPEDQEFASVQTQSRVSLQIELRVQGDNANDYGPEIHNDFPAVFPRQPLKGQDMRLECLAYGRLPLQYSWIRVDAPLSDNISLANLNRVLTIKNVRLEDSGTYQCIVTGSQHTHARNITINVAAAPYFMFPLRNQHLDAGSQLTLTCDAVAIPRATYSWYRNAKSLFSESTQDIQVNGNVLIIKSADAAKHNGMYQCVATNGYGIKSSVAQIRVLPTIAPTFSRNPVERTILGAIGGNLTIVCQPDASPPPTITWTHNGAAVGSGEHSRVLVNGNLLLVGLTKADEGIYTCTAENSAGKNSSSGKLTLMTRTTLNFVPHSQAVAQNETVRLPCQASYQALSTELVYVWYFNGRPLDKRDPAYLLDVESGTKGLNIIGIQFKHEGWYRCEATTVYDSVGAEAYVTVRGPPDEPAGVHAREQVGRTVTLWWEPGSPHGDLITKYRIECNNNFNATWVIFEDQIESSRTIINEVAQWRQYVIKQKFSPGTSYLCRVSAASSNYGFGRPSTPSPEIKIDDAAPVISPYIVTGGEGSVGTLTIKWTPLRNEDWGGDGLYYKAYWRLHNRPNDQWQGSEHKVYATDLDLNGFASYHVVVGEQNFYTEYDVKVQAINNIGPGPNSSEVTIFSAEDIPQASPVNPHSESYNGTACFVTWSLPNNTRESIRGVVKGFQLNWWSWLYKDRGAPEANLKWTRTYGPTLSGMVIGLEHNFDYFVDVQVFNTAGMSAPSGKEYMVPFYDAPYHYPEYVTVMSHGPDSVHVSWRGVSHERQEGNVFGYKIWWWPATDNIRTAKVAEFGKEFSGVITGVERNIVYKLRVLAWGTGGDGRKSPPTYFTLGGQLKIDPQTTEIMSLAIQLQPSFTCLLLSITLVYVRTFYL